MCLRNTYIKDKFLASAILYSHGASELVQEFAFTLELINALKASNMLYVQYRSITFPNKGVGVTNEFLLAKLYQ